MGHLAIDTIIGNFDRHTGNWGYLYNDEAEVEKIKLAPIYDCGSSLYPMLAEKGIAELLSSPKMIDDRIYQYPKAAFSYEGKQISYHDFLLSERVLKDPIACNAIDNISERYDQAKVNNVIENTPAISDIRKEMYKKMLEYRVEKLIVPNLQERRKTVAISSPSLPNVESSPNPSHEMERTWQEYFAKPKEERNGIEWQGTVYRPVEFDDIYIAQCKKEGVTPNKDIANHFTRCVDGLDYTPKHFINSDKEDRH